MIIDFRRLQPRKFAREILKICQVVLEILVKNLLITIIMCDNIFFSFLCVIRG